MTTYSFAQLKDLWMQAGGNPQAAEMAAAIAMAESGGKSDATNTNPDGSIDRGLWQINSVHGSLSTLDPMANAKAAVQISQNGSTWRPWCTAWSGPCSGTYLADSAPYRKFLGGGSTGATGTTDSGTSVTDASLLTNPLDPKAWLQPIFKVLSVWFLYGLMTLAGAWLIWLAVWVLILNNDTARGVLGAAVTRGRANIAKQAKTEAQGKAAITKQTKAGSTK